MSFPRYQSYKDSGVEWLGEVPGHWELKPAKVVSTCNDEVLPESTPDDYEIEYVEISDVNEVSGITETTSLLFGAAPSRARRLVRNGDILVSTVRTYLRAIAPVINPPENMIASTGFAVIRPRSIEPHYLGFVFQTEYLIAEVIARSVGVSYPAINASELMRLNLPIPSTTEQQTIAAFLDRETAKIDALIAEQQRLIALLKEKRQAVILHAVTKGLSVLLPSPCGGGAGGEGVPIKDSGIAWLGEVPAHWEFGRLKRFAEIIDCKHHTVDFLDEGLPIVSIREVRDDKIDLTNAKLTSERKWDFLREGRAPILGDLIFCRNASVGAVGYVDFDTPFCMGQDVCLIRPKTKSRFIHYQLTSPLIRNQIEAFLVGATIRRANVEEIRSLTIVNPPEAEQEKIALFLDGETTKLDTLTTEAQNAIALLKERRSALISAAVTGKIDVRSMDETLAESITTQTL